MANKLNYTSTYDNSELERLGPRAGAPSSGTRRDAGSETELETPQANAGNGNPDDENGHTPQTDVGGGSNDTPTLEAIPAADGDGDRGDRGGDRGGDGGKPDPFDLAAVKRKAATSVAVKKTLVIRVQKRVDKTTWFQVCPHAEMHVEGYLLDPGESAEGLFWVSPHILEEIDDSTIRLYELHLCRTKQGGSLFFWAIALPGEEGRDMECNIVRREYAKELGKWMRLEWNDASRMHDQTIALANWPDPEWPDEPIDNLIRIAFRGRLIESVDHPVVRLLKGLT